MKISIFGLGYVGCATAACLAATGHTVIGVDINPSKVHSIKTGHSPISEPELGELLKNTVECGRLYATLDANAAVRETDISLICVGTPSNHNGCVNLQFIDRVCAEIGKSLKTKTSYHVVVIRSTVLPGTVLNRLVPILGHQAGVNYGVCMNPEFLREGSAIKDFYHPGCTVIGQLDERSGDMVVEMYKEVDAPVIRTDIPIAEMTKYVSNAYHALKITFANEIGALCKTEGVDGQQVMDIFCQDHHLNISPVYLKPGFAFGGSCLPKDVRALAHWAKERDVEAPVLSAILASNQYQIVRAIEMVENTSHKKIGVLGLSFKPATDDVRESPTITLIETLIGRGYDVSVYDEVVNPEKLIGGNRDFLERAIPHIASHMRHSLDEVLQDVDVVVVANGSSSFSCVPQLLRGDQVLIDLVGIAKEHENMEGCYEGICW
jgi:GDP-mannose 6-dehydrogenase